MQRLGYRRYVAQGGDWGSAISGAMARQAPKGLLGIHINLPATVPPEVAAALRGGPRAGGTFGEGARGVRCAGWQRERRAFGVFHNVDCAAADCRLRRDGSPAGLAAWILVHPGFARWMPT